ncbi:MAG: insulinase family protein [Holophagales bacterium]|nr:insulinase family protein [Holophagales bacterium]
MSRRTTVTIALAGALALLAGSAGGQDLASFEKRVSTKKLDNGLTVLVCERPGTPVFSFFTHVDAGSVQEKEGQSGLAHMFEHMAFKGTDRIGTKDVAAERNALAKVEAAFLAYEAERSKLGGGDEKRLAGLEKAWRDAMKEADAFVVNNEFGEIVDREGGVGLNAFTSNDETGYFFSMPANRLELWAYLESSRFLSPVFREFYKEKDVVFEERRMRVDSSPIGRLVEQFLATAFDAHPYGRSGIGWPSDLAAYSATDAEKFFRTYYVPSNMVVTIVGDLKAAEVFPVVEKYFARLPKVPKPAEIRTVEPPQIAEKEVVLVDPSQPFYLEGYHKPSALHPDAAVYDTISDLLSSGRTSRLYRSLVRDKKVAAAAAGFGDFPGSKYPSLFAFYAVPLPGRTNAEVKDAIRDEIERLKTEDVTDAELAMVKTRAKANLIRRLGDNQGLANQLGTYQARFGDWRDLFRDVERIDKVTKADIRRVAGEIFQAKNRTVARIETKVEGPAKPETKGEAKEKKS